MFGLLRTTTRVPSWLRNRTLLTSFASFSAQPPLGPGDETIPDVLHPGDLYHSMLRRKMDFFTGVPDSLLRDFLSYVYDHAPPEKHVIAANEGAAVAIGAGYHLATGRFPVVYLQNSGIGNAVNPLLSLADRSVYAVPMLLLVGWRGEPGHRDEPQHRVQGKVMPGMFAGIDVAFEVLPDYIEGAEDALDTAVDYMKRRSAPFALFVRKQTFEKYTCVITLFIGSAAAVRLQMPCLLYQNLCLALSLFCGDAALLSTVRKDLASIKLTFLSAPHPVRRGLTEQTSEQETALMTRENAMSTIVDNLRSNAAVIATTGFTSRELFELRQRRREAHKTDFLTVGSMGHCAAISYGVAISMQNASQDSRVVCLDGDGSLLMHMGTMATIGSSNVEGAKRLIHIVFNNGAHDSVGGQHTAASHPRVSLAAAAAALGYQRVAKVSTEEELVAVMQEVVMHSNLGGPCFIEVACRRGARSDLGRPKGSPAESKEAFMSFLSQRN